MHLRELQRAFQARVLLLESGIEPELRDAKGADFDARLDAYVGGYRARLVEVLGTNSIVKCGCISIRFRRATIRSAITGPQSRNIWSI